jgi:ATP-dependent Clp protease adapter protein ClpS
MNWTAVDFIVGALFFGAVLYLPFFLWFRLRPPRANTVIARDLEVSLHMAFVSASRMRYEMVTLDQLLLALLDNPSAADVLRRCEIDIAALRGSVSASVRSGTPVTSGATNVEPGASPEFQRVLQRAIARSQAVTQGSLRRRNPLKITSWVSESLRRRGRKKGVDGADLLVALLEESDSTAAEELRRHGLTRRAATSVIAHGITNTYPVTAPPSSADGAQAMAIVVENDDFTPTEFVVEVLQAHVGLDLESAVRVMLQVHHEGRAVAGFFPVEVASAKAARIQEAAGNAGHPLRCVVEAR